MKAMHKQLWGYLLITLSLAGFTPLQAQTDSVDEGGYITVSGIVKDKKSKKSLEYVNISIPAKKIKKKKQKRRLYSLKRMLNVLR